MSENSKDSQENVLTQPSKSDVFEILKNDRRRYMLEILRTQGSQSVSSLSEKIALLEAESNEPKSGGKKNVYDSLLNNHIPKMESLNVIDYDKESDLVNLLPTAKSFDIYIEEVKKNDISWNRFYFGLSAIAIFGGVTIYEGLFKWITSSQWMVATSVFFFVVSIAYYRHVNKY